MPRLIREQVFPAAASVPDPISMLSRSVSAVRTLAAAGLRGRAMSTKPVRLTEAALEQELKQIPQWTKVRAPWGAVV